MYFHVVFSTKNREPWFQPSVRDRLNAYVGGIINNIGGICLAVGGTGDHIHILMRLKPTHQVADVVKGIKTDTSKWIKDELNLAGFSWQEGYGVFTVGPADTESVRTYVLNQEAHHQEKSFQEEYLQMLNRANIEYDESYLW